MRNLLFIIFIATFVNTVQAQVGALIWEEPFDTLDTEIWNIQIGDGCPDLCYWGNGEMQYYKEENVYTDSIPGEPGNKGLVIEARKERAPNGGRFTSGRLNTQDQVEIRYGVIEIRMMVPDLETGLWPAAWLLGANNPEVGWPQSGEIDMMEMGHSLDERTNQGHPDSNVNSYVGSNAIWYASSACSDGNPTCAAAIAYDTQYNQPYSADLDMNDRFVTYRLYWDPNSLRFTITDRRTEYDLYTSPLSISSGDLANTFRKPFFVLLNMAVGGNFTDASVSTEVTAPFPAKMYVDYIKVFSWNGEGEVTVNGELVSKEFEATSPSSIQLNQNYPNPFNPETVIGYQLESPANVRVRVFDALGREVSELVNAKRSAGYHEVRFNAANLPSGLYYYRLETGSFVQTRKMMLIK